MLTTRMCEVGADTGTQYTVVTERQGSRGVGYCALACPGHNSSAKALAHHTQFESTASLQNLLQQRLDRQAASAAP